jgi:mannose-1-phosphate guanylyltransferase
MKAIILSGGKGTRLLPLTLNTPKPMLPIGGKPHLEYIIELLKTHGITDIVFSTGYLHEHILEYFGDGRKFGVKIQYKEDGDKPLGTAGAIKNCLDEVGSENFLVFNGDILTNIDLTGIINIHKKNSRSHKDITIALAPVDDPSSFGVAVKDNGRITSFIEKPKSLTYGNHINAGIYIMNKEALEDIPSNEFSMVETDVFPAHAINSHMFYYLEEDMYWLDIGTHERYGQANSDILKLFSTFFKK